MNWEDVTKNDVQRWIAWLLGTYSAACASSQFRALQQFFRWLAAEEQARDPVAGLGPPRVPGKPVQVFTGQELPRLCRPGLPGAPRRGGDRRARGHRHPPAELAGIRYDPADPRRGDLDLWHREITVRGKGRKTPTVRISHDAARALDRYLRVRARHARHTSRSYGSGPATGAR